MKPESFRPCVRTMQSHGMVRRKEMLTAWKNKSRLEGRLSGTTYSAKVCVEWAIPVGTHVRREQEMHLPSMAYLQVPSCLLSPLR